MIAANLGINQRTVENHRASIPHHAGAILMCEHAKLESAETKSLCRSILEALLGIDVESHDFVTKSPRSGVKNSTKSV